MHYYIILYNILCYILLYINILCYICTTICTICTIGTLSLHCCTYVILFLFYFILFYLTLFYLIVSFLRCIGVGTCCLSYWMPKFPSGSIKYLSIYLSIEGRSLEDWIGTLSTRQASALLQRLRMRGNTNCKEKQRRATRSWSYFEVFYSRKKFPFSAE